MPTFNRSQDHYMKRTIYDTRDDHFHSFSEIRNFFIDLPTIQCLSNNYFTKSLGGTAL
jgi:hypothetical protein